MLLPIRRVIALAVSLLTLQVPAVFAAPAAPEAPVRNLPPVFDAAAMKGKVFHDSRVRSYLAPQRILWQSGNVKNADVLAAGNNDGQSNLATRRPACVLKYAKNDEKSPAILLDFGREIHGGIQLVTTVAGSHNAIRVRVRFGESATEAMTDTPARGSTNEHAARDFTMNVPWLGVAEAGNSGFRFARIDLPDPGTELNLKEVNAIFVYRDIPYLGSFRSSDDRLNRIWLTGAYTVHLNMQEYLWDGIKRDRLVWLGDMHPEVMTINAVFGHNEVVPRSLDLARDSTPLPRWMNGMCSYSLWWVIIHRDWWRQHADLPYLQAQRKYLTGLLNHLFTQVGPDGKERLGGGGRFLDWPSSPNRKGVDAGLQGLMVLTFDAGAELCTVLGDAPLAARCAETAERMRRNVPAHNNLKQGAALLSIAGMGDAKKFNTEVVSVNGPAGFSTFYGYYMLQAQAKAGDYQTALDVIRRYWGGMLDMGATTFWEDFDLAWTRNAAGIDELVPAGKKDIHADFGAYCYKNLRHSLCHGWASGPTAWLSEHVLGVHVLEPGCKALRIEPHLGDLEFVEGTFPTPYGVVHLHHKKTADGKVVSKITAPPQVRIVQGASEGK